MYGFKHVKNEYPLPFIYWISLVLVPFGTLILLLIIFSDNSVPSIYITASIGIVFIINIVTFYLYDRISNFMLEQMNRRLVEEQNKYYEHQIELMKTSLENIKIFRHDLKNKLSPIYNLAVSGRNQELIERISELTETCCGNYGQIISGNSDLDSIINFKLQRAEKENIKVSTKIIVPAKLAPLEDENKRLDEKEQRILKRRTNTVLLILTIIILFVNFIGQFPFSICITMSICTSAFMLILGKIKYIFKQLK